MGRFPYLAAGLAAFVATSAPALAERVDDKYWLNGQALFAHSKAVIRIDNSDTGANGTPIDLAKQLGQGRNRTIPTILLGGRFSNKWRAELEYLALPQHATRVLDNDITVGDTTYAANGTLTSRFRTDIYRFVVGYSPIKTDTAELGFSIGAHITTFRAGFEGVGSVNGNPATLETFSRTQLAPLPTIGAYGNYSLSPMFSLYGRADLFALTIDKYSGHLYDLQGGVQARVAKNFGIGAGYRYVEYQIGIKGDNLRGRINYKFNGPLIFAELAF